MEKALSGHTYWCYHVSNVSQPDLQRYKNIWCLFYFQRTEAGAFGTVFYWENWLNKVLFILKNGIEFESMITKRIYQIYGRCFQKTPGFLVADMLLVYIHKIIADESVDAWENVFIVGAFEPRSTHLCSGRNLENNGAGSSQSITEFKRKRSPI